MARDQQHHTYHMGLLACGIVDELNLHSSCDFPSTLRDLHGVGRVRYRGTLGTYVAMLRHGLRFRGRVMVVGLPSSRAWTLLPLLVLRPRSVTIHLHGQIVSIRSPLKRLWWRTISLGAVLQVPNPIFEGPAWITPVAHPSAPSVIVRSGERIQRCLLYGSNKHWLGDKTVQNRIRQAGYSLEVLVDPDSYIDFDSIISRARYAGYTFLQMDPDHYALSPSGRLGCDVRVLDLVPLVLSEDLGTQSILERYGVGFELI